MLTLLFCSWWVAKDQFVEEERTRKAATSRGSEWRGNIDLAGH